MVSGQEFQSTPSGGKATFCVLTSILYMEFQSTPSGGKATKAIGVDKNTIAFQSTPSGGKASEHGMQARIFVCVSIHAFRGEGDGRVFADIVGALFQSTPSGGKATPRSSPSLFFEPFQSTPSGGKATNSCAFIIPHIVVSIHAFRGEGDSLSCGSCGSIIVSIHAFRGEGEGFGLS